MIPTFLEKISFLKDLDAKTLQAFMESLQEKDLLRGEVLFLEGDEGDTLYILATGRALVYKEGDNEIQNLKVLQPGDMVGEMALISKGIRSASVKALRSCRFYSLNQEDFDRFLGENTHATRYLLKNLVQRLRQSNTSREKASLPKAMVFLSYMPCEASFWGMVETCKRTLKTHDNVTLFYPENPQSDHQSQWSETLDDLENRYDAVLMPVSKPDTPWAAFCLGHGDIFYPMMKGPLQGQERTLKVLHKGYEKKEYLGQDGFQRKNPLIWFHESSLSNPSQTSQALKILNSDRVHHVRHASHPDWRRLARFMRHKSLNLVLGGGGARGFAHIGILRALEERGYAIDGIGGTSMGALVGAGMALGLDARELQARMKSFFLEGRGLYHLNLPLFSLLDGETIEKTLRNFFQDIDLSDLWHPFLCISTNLANAEKYIHRQGDVVDALMASFSIPGLLPPRIHHEHILVDGAFVDNLPLKPMKDFVHGHFICANVTPQEDPAFETTFTKFPQGWHLWKHFLGFGNTQSLPPKLLSLLIRSTTINSAHRLSSLRAETPFFMDIPLEGFNVSDWKKMEAIIQSGYETARTWLTLNEDRLKASLSGSC